MLVVAIGSQELVFLRIPKEGVAGLPLLHVEVWKVVETREIESIKIIQLKNDNFLDHHFI